MLFVVCQCLIVWLDWIISYHIFVSVDSRAHIHSFEHSIFSFGILSITSDSLQDVDFLLRQDVECRLDFM